MKGNLKGLLKIILIILCCLILISIGAFMVYQHIQQQRQIEDNINYIYNIYNNDNRQEIINEYPTTVNNNETTTLGIPVESEENKTQMLNALAVLEIPSISFKDIVIEGTTQEVLAQGIGLFEHSSILQGNVCLAGHNTTRFFANLKDVKEGEIIKYSSCLGNREYKITTIKQIEETDWSMLEDTEDNRITIITCVKNQPTLRLCVQATEVK